MPYIIITSDAGPDEDFEGLSCERCGINPAATCECTITRRAVATLEEEIEERLTGTQIEMLENGEAVTVGPLPDGTVIEVAPTTYLALDGAEGMGESEPVAPATHRAIINAYNATRGKATSE